MGFTKNLQWPCGRWSLVLLEKAFSSRGSRIFLHSGRTAELGGLGYPLVEQGNVVTPRLSDWAELCSSGARWLSLKIPVWKIHTVARSRAQ